MIEVEPFRGVPKPRFERLLERARMRLGPKRIAAPRDLQRSSHVVSLPATPRAKAAGRAPPTAGPTAQAATTSRVSTPYRSRSTSIHRSNAASALVSSPRRRHQRPPQARRRPAAPGPWTARESPTTTSRPPMLPQESLGTGSDQVESVVRHQPAPQQTPKRLPRSTLRFPTASPGRPRSSPRAGPVIRESLAPVPVDPERASP